jgi:uncharacterized membrane protein
MPEEVSAPDPGGPPNAGTQDVLEGIQGLHKRIADLEKLLVMSGAGVAPELRKSLGPDFRNPFVPAWRRVTRGEPRWHAALAVTIAIVLQGPLPDRLVLFRPTWLLPVLEGALLVMLLALGQYRVDTESKLVRMLGLTAAAILSVANAWSAVHLVIELVQGTMANSAGPLLTSGAVIWLTNVIVFALWYWDFDRGGPAARAHATHQVPDFMFPQMTSPGLAPKDWEPMFPDYAYLAFTNAIAFSPTDTMPMTRWAKAAMTLQSMVSIVVVALVVARAVNILK